MIESKKSKLFQVLMIILLLSLSIAGSAAAQDTDPPTDDEVNAIAKDMYCPVCENIPLDVCGTVACEEWRNLIREMLSEGATESEIKAEFVAKYGDRVLAEPPVRGLNWLVYIVPPAAFLLGAFLLYRGFKSWQVADEPAEDIEAVEAEPDKALDDDYLARMEEELRRSDQ